LNWRAPIPGEKKGETPTSQQKGRQQKRTPSVWPLFSGIQLLVLDDMQPKPTKLELVQTNRLRITWSDGQVREYAARELRDHCPCATCREKRKAPPSQLPIISAAEAQPLGITRMNPVGNYAYSIEFSDGHNTGIYTLESLRALGTEV